MRRVVRKWTHRFIKVFNANARIVVRKCAHCLKWRWSSPGSGSRCTIAVFVHHWCTIAALSRSQRYNVALSCSHNVAISSTQLTLSLCMQKHIVESFIMHWRTIAVATVHCCTIMLSQRCNIALSCSHDIVIMFYHKFVLHTISNRAFIATLETIVVLTENVYPLFSMVYISPMSNVLYNVDVRTM